MEREVSSMLSLSIMLIAMAALLSIVWLTIMIGSDIKESSFEAGVEIAEDLNGSQLDSIKYREDIVMPKAAVYSLLSQEHAYISKMFYEDMFGKKYEIVFGEKAWEVYDITNGGREKQMSEYTFPQDILATKLSGKSKLLVEPDGKATFVISVIDLLNK